MVGSKTGEAVLDVADITAASSSVIVQRKSRCAAAALTISRAALTVRDGTLEASLLIGRECEVAGDTGGTEVVSGAGQAVGDVAGDARSCGTNGQVVGAC